jgi:hypothetical protein
MCSPTDLKADLAAKQSQKNLKSFIVAFLMPTLVGKSLVIYFGLNYSEYPGEGYGYGLVGSLTFTVIMLLRFVWKYKDVEDI